MAQAVRRLAWPSSEVEQAEKRARVWADGLVELHQRIGGRFGRVEPRRRALAGAWFKDPEGNILSVVQLPAT